MREQREALENIETSFVFAPTDDHMFFRPPFDFLTLQTVTTDNQFCFVFFFLIIVLWIDIHSPRVSRPNL